MLPRALPPSEHTILSIAKGDRTSLQLQVGGAVLLPCIVTRTEMTLRGLRVERNSIWFWNRWFGAGDSFEPVICSSQWFVWVSDLFPVICLFPKRADSVRSTKKAVIIYWRWFWVEPVKHLWNPGLEKEQRGGIFIWNTTNTTFRSAFIFDSDIFADQLKLLMVLIRMESESN